MARFFLVAILLAYPLIVFFGIQTVSASSIGFVMLCIVLLRFWHFRKVLHQFPALPIVTAACVVLLLWGSFANSDYALKLYPVVVNLSFFAVFAYSLIKPPAIITLIASIKDKLDDKAIVYTQKVTFVWCLFFILNASIALFTTFSDNPYHWVVYNGLISYILMGVLMLAEWLIRRYVRTKHENQSL